MEDWIRGELSKYKISEVYIDFSLHALKDKNLKPEDFDRAIETVRTGRIVPEKCNKDVLTVCFRRHFGKENVTYTVIVALYPNFMRIVTIWKESGRK